MLLASDGFHNFLSPHDVNDDSRVSAADALVVINHLTRDDSQDTNYFEDVNDDGTVSARDALNVINELSRARSGSGATDEAIARLYGVDGVRVKLEFEIEDSQWKLEVKVQNATPNESFEVRIDGLRVGQLTTDGRGRGELEFGSNDDDLPLPSNLPQIRPGMVAQIVGLGESQFASSVDSSSNSDSSSNDNSSSNSSDDNSSGGSSNDSSSSTSSVSAGDTFELKAQLTGIASIDAEAKYESTANNVEFKIELKDAAASASYSVVVGGVVVGTLQTDNRGRGRLQFELEDNSEPFPANFPSVGVGTEISVGNQLVGVFEVGSNDD